MHSTWSIVHEERWRAVLAFVRRETESEETETFVEVGRKVTVVGFRDEAVVEVVPAPVARPSLRHQHQGSRLKGCLL